MGTCQEKCRDGADRMINDNCSNVEGIELERCLAKCEDWYVYCMSSNCISTENKG